MEVIVGLVVAIVVLSLITSLFAFVVALGISHRRRGRRTAPSVAVRSVRMGEGRRLT